MKGRYSLRVPSGSVVAGLDAEQGGHLWFDPLRPVHPGDVVALWRRGPYWPVIARCRAHLGNVVVVTIGDADSEVPMGELNAIHVASEWQPTYLQEIAL